MASEGTGERPGAGRSEQREATIAKIKRASRSLLVAEGVRAVRLRAVAREVGLTAPALYRYVAGHEDLVRLLTEDIYDDLTAAVERAAATADGEPSDPAGRLAAAARAFRTWALDHRRELELVFVSPVPPPGEPAGRTPSRLRLVATFGRIFADVWRARPFPVPAAADLPEHVRRTLAPVARDLLPGLPLGAAYVFASCWERLYGAVCLEVFGHLAWAVDDGEPLFEQMLSELRDRTSAPA